MYQSDLPKFISIQFYPGYGCTVGASTLSATGMYVALAENGRAYAHLMGCDEWQMIGEPTTCVD